MATITFSYGLCGFYVVDLGAFWQTYTEYLFRGVVQINTFEILDVKQIIV